MTYELSGGDRVGFVLQVRDGWAGSGVADV